MSHSNPLLSIRNLSIQFKTGHQTTTVVDGISFDVYQGETVALVGESGSGKSVTALSVVKLLPYPTASHPGGEIVFQGRDLMPLTDAALQEVRGKDIAFIFQEPLTALNPLHTVEKQIKEVLDLHTTLSEAEKQQRILTLLQDVGFAEGVHRLKAYPHELSGGQRQRVMIAMALAADPKLLIADEPTTALDVTTQQQILILLKTLQQQRQLAVLLITHDLNVVKQNADRVVVMRHGQVVETNTLKTLFHRPQHPYTQELIAAEPSGTAVPLLAPAQPCLAVKDLSVHFPIKKGIWKRTVDYAKALDEATFTINKGETLGVVGESGSGKTTLALALLRLNRLTKGAILFQGADDVAHSVIDLAQLFGKAVRPYRRHIQMVFQDPFGSLSPRLSIGEIIAEGLDVHQLYHSKAERTQRVQDALAEVGLDPLMAARYPHEFSGGQRQRIAIARALVLNPKVLILDEPTSALDRAVQVTILELLKKLQRERHLSYIFISHDLKVVQSLAHHVIVMQSGKIIEYGRARDILHTPQHPYTKMLVKAAFTAL
jgi:ABC-type uncharacterized transport system, duplicated ATPase component